MALSPTAIASSCAQETDEVWLVLLRIDHPALSEPILVVNNTENIVSNGLTYIGLAFEVTLPSDDDSTGEFSARLDCVDREIVDAVNACTSRPTAVLSLILASEPDTLVMTADSVAVSFDADAQEMNATFRADDMFYDSYPGIRYTPASHPGLF